MTLRLPARRSKYAAIRTAVDGIVFASKKEAARYGELKLLEKAGEIHGLEVQPVFLLYVPNGDSTTSVGKYVADFRYRRGPTGILVVEDVKGGIKTAVYRLKKKMVEATYGIRITEV